MMPQSFNQSQLQANDGRSDVPYWICMNGLERALIILANYRPSIAPHGILLCHLCTRYI